MILWDQQGGSKDLYPADVDRHRAEPDPRRSGDRLNAAVSQAAVQRGRVPG